MGTALVMEHANALAQMIVSEKDKLFDERVEALGKRPIVGTVIKSAARLSGTV